MQSPEGKAPVLRALVSFAYSFHGRAGGLYVQASS